jgi:hypothetical protein
MLFCAKQLLTCLGRLALGRHFDAGNRVEGSRRRSKLRRRVALAQKSASKSHFPKTASKRKSHIHFAAQIGIEVPLAQATAQNFLEGPSIENNFERLDWPLSQGFETTSKRNSIITQHSFATQIAFRKTVSKAKSHLPKVPLAQRQSLT